MLKEVNIKLGFANQDTTKDKVTAAMKRSSSPHKLDPFLDDDGVLRVGG